MPSLASPEECELLCFQHLFVIADYLLVGLMAVCASAG